MKELKFEIPAGCEVDKIETQDGHIFVTFREKERKERKEPKSWEEFYDMTGIKIPYNLNQKIKYVVNDNAVTEAVLALLKLIQLRNAYNGDWVPNWKNYNQDKFTIEFHCSEIFCDCVLIISTPLYFKTEELRDEFLRNFRPLVEKLKPLYGIKEGGEE